MSNWFDRGDEGVLKSKQIDKELELKRAQKGNFPFHLALNETGQLTFLDSPKFYFSQHSVKMGNSYIPLTCIKEMDNCPLCQSGLNPAYVATATVIDHREYVSKKTGERFKNQKRVIVLKGRAKARILQLMSQNGNDVAGCLMTVTRGPEPQSCGTGEVFDILKKVPMDVLKRMAPKPKEGQTAEQAAEEFITPLDYATMFAPKTAEELRALLGGSDVPVGASQDPFAGLEDTAPPAAPSETPIPSVEESLADLI